MKIKWLAVLAILFAGAAHAQSGPTCNPGDYSPTVNYHVGVSANGSIVGFIWCNDANGLEQYNWAWNPATTPTVACAGNVSGKTVGLALMAVWSNCMTTTTFSSDESTAIASLANKWMPHLIVAPGGSHTVWSYAACANLACAPVNTGQRIASGIQCAFPGGVAATQPAPNQYYNVAGRVSTTGNVLPNGSFTPCVEAATPSAGWP